MPCRLRHLAEAAAHLLDHEGVAKLGEGVGRVAEHIDDRFAVFDVELDTFVTVTVSDEQERAVSMWPA